MPDGKLPGPRWRPVAAVAITAIVLFTVTAALVPADDGRSPIAIEALRPLQLFTLPIVGTLAAIAAVSAVGLVVRTARARGPLRLQLLWICVGAVLAVLGAFLPALVPLPGAGVPFILALPICVAVAMLRHDLYETGLPLRRFLTLALLAGALVLLYLLVVRLTGNTIPATVAVAVAVAVEPLHHWLGRAAGHPVSAGAPTRRKSTPAWPAASPTPRTRPESWPPSGTPWWKPSGLRTRKSNSAATTSP